ncbi:unnamed protein product [Paramecium primaurelia]|uniref:Protein kinase domain-containing protein n=1 Tax=Paramecium primaurelia TaxID=5886 RepID=A0A8S1L5N1_PARPR|nr:unnamed protein product [Paramecium primaurelia]
MGQNWGSPQIVQQSMISNSEFLKQEVDAQLTLEKCPHLRHLIDFDFYQDKNQSENQKKVKFNCKPDFTKLKSLELLNLENQINFNHFQDIFQQLIEGLYEMHKNNFIGRCISIECITYTIGKTLNYGSFGYFHSVDQLQFPPECLYKLINTYETDYWLVAKIMWQLYNKKREYYGKSIQQLGQDLLKFEIKAQYIDENKEPNQLVKLINKMLPINCGQRISIYKVLDQLNFKLKEEMKSFYSNYEFGPYFLRLMKSTQKRDYQKIFVYEIDLTNKICNNFCQEIFQILLTYIALQLSFHFPTKEENIYPLLLSTLSKYLTISSKILKDKLILQEQGHMGDTENYIKLLQQIINSHNQAYKFEKHVIKQWQMDFQQLKGLNDQEKIKIINFKLYQFRALANEPETIAQKILLNLLCNLNVKEFKSQNLELDLLKFLQEIQRKK